MSGSDSRAKVALLGLALWLAALGVGAEEGTPASGRTHLLSVELLDDSGQPVVVQSANDFLVTSEGEHLQPVALSEAGEWQVTLLFDQRLSESRVIQNAAVRVAEMADQLVGLGPVEIVLGAEEFTRSMLPTRDAEELRQALGWLRVRERAEAAQLEIRRKFFRDFAIEDLARQPYAAVSATASRKLAELRFGVAQALQDEARVIEEQRRRLLEWALENRREAPALLLMVTGGEDDRLPFYQSVLEAVGASEVLDELGIEPLDPRREDLGRVLSSIGWLTMTFAPAFSEALEEEGGAGRQAGDQRVETVMQDGQVVDRTIFTPRFDPRDLFRRQGETGEVLPEPRLLAPLDTAVQIAEATGGDVVVDGQALERVLAELGRRVHLQVIDSSSSYELRRIEVRYQGDGGDGVPWLRTRQWIGSATAEIVAEIRARRLLEDGAEEGQLMVTAQAVDRDGIDGLRVEIEPPDERMLEIGSGPLRLTVGALEDDDRALFDHSILSVGVGIERTERGALALETDLRIEPRSGGPLVVLVEDLATGRWGGTYASVVTGFTEDLSGLLSTTPRAIHLLEPEGTMVVGSTLFETVHDSQVARVEFFLDGAFAGERSIPPFTMRVDLGRLPEPHRVEVVAYDSEGREVGRDRLSLNESGNVFRVRIVRPRSQDRERQRQLLVGPVEVEARVEAPRTMPVARVEYFWNEELIATRFAPPYVQRVPVPEESPRGFFRVVAYLEDGASAEDVLFVNSPGGTERVKVELVQLYAVVTDRDGRPIQGLEADSFKILEEGREREIATFSEASDQPLTVGLAIDTSASMFVKLPRVQGAASGFLRGLDGGKDRAFVVDFGAEPDLHHDTSGNLEAIEASLLELEPDGRTAIWKGISFSLVQLQGVQGKKALIVFSDGADEDPDFSYRTCLKFARRVGVPVYVIVSNDEIYRTGGRGLNVRSFIGRLESLTRAVGGRLYFSRVGEDLEEIYAQIDEELRSQYVLGYYADDEGDERWRSVRIEIDRPGARARTVAGYFR